MRTTILLLVVAMGAIADNIADGRAVDALALIHALVLLRRATLRRLLLLYTNTNTNNK